MSEVYPLDSVIHRLKNFDKNKPGLKSGKIIRLDANKGEILPKKRKFAFFLDLRYYWVSTRNRAKNETECRIEDFSTEQSIVVKVKYEVKCEPQNEDKVVLALYKENNPGAALNRLLEDWTQDFADDLRKKGVSPVLEYFNFRDELMDFLVDKVEKNVGLSIKFNLSLKNEDNDELKGYKINSDYFPLHVKDFDEELNLRFNTELRVKEKKKIFAFLNYNKLKELEPLIQAQIKKYALKNIKFHDFVYNLNTIVKEDLTAVLNNILEEKGREVAWLNLETNLTKKFPEPVKNIYHSVECDIKDYANKIEIRHKLLMQLEDLGKYKSQNVSMELEEWAREKLEHITQNILFEKNYVDILLDFEQEEEKQKILNSVKKGMQKIAGQIGYTVKHLIVEPKLEPLKLKKDGFTVEEKEAGFATRDNRVNVKLGIVVTGKIKDLRKISEYIKPDANIEEEMKRTVIEEIRKKMHEIEPEHFYMPFNYPDKKSVEEQLKEIIEKELKRKFFAEEINVIIKIVETELIERIRDLIGGSPYRFKIDVLPHQSSGHRETVTFEGEFLIRGVDKDGWQPLLFRKFEHRDQEVNKIRETLEEDIKAKFQKIPVDILLTSDFTKSQELLKVARMSHGKIAGIFGLNIFVSLLSRNATIIENANQKILQRQVEAQLEKEHEIIEINNEADLDNLRKLHEIKSDMLDPDLIDDEKIAEIDKKIKEIARKSSHPADKGRKLLKPGEEKSSEEFDLGVFTDDFFKNDALPSGEESPGPN